jgi:hypothetical protein
VTEPENDPLLALTDRQVDQLRAVPPLAVLEGRKEGFRMSPIALEADALQAALIVDPEDTSG